MFRPLRRDAKKISDEDAKNVLKQSRYGFLAVNGEEGYPYTIPVNYLYVEEENAIYFHGSNEGLKADCIKANDKVCFTVTGKEEIVKEDWAPFVSSTVVYGRCHILNDRVLTIELVKKLASKYYPNEELIKREVTLASARVYIYKIDIEHLCGKRVQEK